MSKRKLLLADDSVTIQKVVNLTFADEGVEVIAVGNGDDAMDRIADSVPDVVLADVHMPGLNGYQICERVRANPETRDLPVVLLVGSFEPFDEGEAERVGANSYLTKPFQSIRQLVSQVTSLMETSARPEPTIEGMFDEHPAVTEFVAEDSGQGNGLEATAAEPERTDRPAETNDIESLYQKSFSEPQHVDEALPESKPFVDAGMDDEMIEATSLSSEPVAVEQYTAYEPAPESASQDQAYTANNPWASVAAHDQAEHGYQSEAGTITESAQVYSEPVSENYQGYEEAVTDSYQAYAQPLAENSGYTQADADQRDSDVDRFAHTEEIPAVTAEFITEQISRDTQTFVLDDDTELLELPPVEGGKTASDDTSAGSENKQVVSLSPEQMEALVQKVVERLSEKR